MYQVLIGTTTAYPWYDSHFISISVCGIWGGKDWSSSLQEGVSHIYTLIGQECIDPFGNLIKLIS